MNLRRTFYRLVRDICDILAEEAEDALEKLDEREKESKESEDPLLENGQILENGQRPKTETETETETEIEDTEVEDLATTKEACAVTSKEGQDIVFQVTKYSSLVLPVTAKCCVDHEPQKMWALISPNGQYIGCVMDKVKGEEYLADWLSDLVKERMTIGAD